MSVRPPQITEDHLRRRAIGYIRQSSAEQLRDHAGSTAVQRDLPALLQIWGWSPDQIELIDEDLGVSGSRPGLRQGFNRLLELMRTGAIGIVAVTDSSRLTRNVLDLARFAVVARQHNVLLAQGGQVVDFRDPTSEFVGLLLGLNAVRENRARAAFARQTRRKKAEAGYATTTPPVGYARTAPGAWAKDDDLRVREITQLVFDKFLEIGSAAGVTRWFRRSGTKLPGRLVQSRRQWVDTTFARINAMLRNPAYTGIYVYGKTSARDVSDSSDSDHKRYIRAPRTEWVWIEDHHEAYVSSREWAEMQRRLTNNRNNARPPLGRGEALVQGLLRCSIHNVTLGTFYPYRDYRAAGEIGRAGCYRCDAGDRTGVNGSCGRILAALVDQAVVSELLKTVVPPSLDDVRDAAREALRTHEALIRARQDELRRADQSVAEAERAFDQVDDGHPYLKARLAERLDETLRQRGQLRERHLLTPLTPPLALDANELAELAHLIEDLPRLWRDPSVTPEQRKAVVRVLIEGITVTPRPEAWTLEIRWVGGAITSLTVLTGRGIRTTVHQLHESGLTPAEIAHRLASQGVAHHFGSLAGKPYSESSIRRMLTRMHPAPRPIEVPAYPYIRQRFADGLPSRAIADELNARGCPHVLGTWTANRVDQAVRIIRRGGIPGIEPLPHIPPLAEAVRALHDAGLPPSEIATRLREQKVLSRRRREATVKTVIVVLHRLGLRPNRNSSSQSAAQRT